MFAIASVVLAATVPPADRIAFIEPGIGYVRSVDRSGGYFGTTTLGYAALARFLAIGGHVDTTTNFDVSSYALGGSLGAQVFPAERFRIAVFAESGVHVYAAGTTFASVGYAGGRFLTAMHLGKSGRVHFGATVFYRHDLAKKEIEYQKASFSLGSATLSRTTVGEGTLGAMLVVGVSF